jgi:hypothetical protein
MEKGGVLFGMTILALHRQLKGRFVSIAGCSWIWKFQEPRFPVPTVGGLRPQPQTE